MYKDPYMQQKFKGKVRGIVEALNLMRVEQGIDMSFARYIEKEFSVTPSAFYESLDLDPATITVEQFLTLDEDQKWLFPEVIRDAIRYGLARVAFTNDIIANQTTLQGSAYEMPWFDFTKIKSLEGKKYTPGATIDEDTISVGTKRVSTSKKAKAIKVPYETIRRTKINILPLYFMGVARRLMKDINNEGITVLISGDGAIDNNKNAVDQSAAVIGVDDTGNGITEDDIIKVFTKMAEIHKTPTTIIGNFNEIRKIEKFDVFSKKVIGNEKIKLETKTPLPNTIDRFVSAKVPDGKLIILNKTLVLLLLISQPLLVESERIITKQLNVAVASIETGFGIVDRGGRVVLDGSVEFSSNDFPVWLEY